MHFNELLTALLDNVTCSHGDMLIFVLLLLLLLLVLLLLLLLLYSMVHGGIIKYATTIQNRLDMACRQREYYPAT